MLLDYQYLTRTYVCGLPEDGTPVPKHVGVILIFVDSMKMALRCRNM